MPRMSRLGLDGGDCRILEVVQRNGRVTYVDLAAQTMLSPSACLRRNHLLEETKVITQYVALLDPVKVGLDIVAYCQVTLEK